jgi:hypothetical protein
MALLKDAVTGVEPERDELPVLDLQLAVQRRLRGDGGAAGRLACPATRRGVRQRGWWSTNSSMPSLIRVCAHRTRRLAEPEGMRFFTIEKCY